MGGCQDLSGEDCRGNQRFHELEKHEDRSIPEACVPLEVQRFRSATTA